MGDRAEAFQLRSFSEKLKALESEIFPLEKPSKVSLEAVIDAVVDV